MQVCTDLVSPEPGDSTFKVHFSSSAAEPKPDDVSLYGTPKEEVAPNQPPVPQQPQQQQQQQQQQQPQNNQPGLHRQSSATR